VSALPPGIRKAREADIPRLIEIRASVRENRLADAASIGAEAYRPYLVNGLCWVAQADGRIAGFAALDSAESSVWALFVAPEAEGRGHGRALLAHLTATARRLGLARLTLSTDAGSRAERLYRRAGWVEAGRDGAAVLMRLPL
jgi:GNAT superfamily N-acetyltransferase